MPCLGASMNTQTGESAMARKINPAMASSIAAILSGGGPTLPRMPLCFIEPQEAIRVVAESVGREARRQLLGEVVRAWVDEIPDDELDQHYAKAVDDLDDDDLSMLAAWHASLEVGHPIANKEFLLGAFSRLGEHRREALRIAAGAPGAGGLPSRGRGGAGPAPRVPGPPPPRPGGPSGG